jgi:hypothetical protein
MTRAPHTGAGRLPPDWVRIYKDYRLGVYSIRHIARLQGISEGAIRKRAKREGWKRDLGPVVRQMARELLLKQDAEEAQARGLLKGSDGTQSTQSTHCPMCGR